MNPFHAQTPYNTEDRNGNVVTIHKVLDDGRLLGVISFGGSSNYSFLGDENGVAHDGFADLFPPKMPGLAAYEALSPYSTERQVIYLTIQANQKILGVKLLREYLGKDEARLGLGEAKRLWEYLQDERAA